MTAIGVGLLFIGAVLYAFFGRPYDPDMSAIEWLVIVCLGAGAVLFAAGIFVWLWRVMP